MSAPGSTGFLEQAVRSLRDETAGAGRRRDDTGDPGAETLARVLVAVRRRARQRRVLAIVALQAGLATFGFGAWAAASGRLGALLDSIRPSPPPAPAAPNTARRPRAIRTTAAVPAPPPVAAPAPVPIRPAVARRIAAASAPAVADGPGAEDENRLYRDAHQAHFVKRDFAAALAAWDRYLALPRPGRLALEARYNRAIALYRLGRRDEAARALQPFADGDYGPYRQPEARALLKQP